MKKYFLLLLGLSSMLMSCDNTTPKKEDVMVSEIILAPTELSVRAGQTADITATVLPEDATSQRIIWALEDPESIEFATVNNAGMITALKKGTLTVVASAVDGSGVKATCKVTVLASKGGAPYAIGDLYPDGDDPIGVVFAVENEGMNGKIVALDYEQDVTWGDDHTTTEATLDTDGLKNTRLVKSNSSDFSLYPAFKWVNDNYNNGSADYNTGVKNVWYIPAQKELRQLFAAMCGLTWKDGSGGMVFNGKIYDWGTDMAMPGYRNYEDKVAAFNQLIEDNGGRAIDHDWHWSSTEVVDYFAWYVDLYSGYTYHFHKGTPSNVRAVMAF